MAKSLWSNLRRLLSVVAVALGLTACGGGIVPDDNNGTTQTLICATTCMSSSTLAANQIRASYAIVSDGQKAQAQAGFSSGVDLRFNVALDGGDSLTLSTPQGTQAFHIPTSATLGNEFVAVFTTLIEGAEAYVSEVTLPTAALPVQFQLVHGGTTYSASVTLPAPYQIVSPAAGATLPISTQTLVVQVTSAWSGVTYNAVALNCTDANGNTANGGQELDIAQGSQTSTTNPTYSLDLGAALDSLIFSSTYPRGAIASCDATLSITQQSPGQGDARLQSTQILGQQIRTVSFTLH